MKEITVVGEELLLDRSGPAKWIADHVAGPVSYLRVLADYGVPLLRRSFHASKRETPDVVLLPTLFRHALVCLDSIHMQLEVGAVRGAIPSLRSLLETELSIEWIITQGKERWGAQFYVSELRQRRAWQATIVPGSPENTLLLEQAPRVLAKGLDDPEQIRAARESIRRIDEHIAQYPHFREINEWFEEVKRGPREPFWFQPNGGPRTRRAMAKKLGRLTEYDVWYRGWSEVHHASRTSGNVAIPERGKMFIQPIRGMDDLAPVLDAAGRVAERTFLTIVNEYRQGDLFPKKLVGEWKKIRQVPDIETKMEALDWV